MYEEKLNLINDSNKYKLDELNKPIKSMKS